MQIMEKERMCCVDYVDWMEADVNVSLQTIVRKGRSLIRQIIEVTKQSAFHWKIDFRYFD